MNGINVINRVSLSGTVLIYTHNQSIYLLESSEAVKSILISDTDLDSIPFLSNKMFLSFILKIKKVY